LFGTEICHYKGDKLLLRFTGDMRVIFIIAFVKTAIPAAEISSFIFSTAIKSWLSGRTAALKTNKEAPW